jgi:hypothetical protein
MKPAALLDQRADDRIYGDYPALYALGIVVPVRLVRRKRPVVFIVAGLVFITALAAAGAAAFTLL